jgi:hypothetical protein
MIKDLLITNLRFSHVCWGDAYLIRITVVAINVTKVLHFLVSA